MKGERTLKDQPFRYGGIMHNYDWDVEQWQTSGIKHDPMRRCYICGGKMRNCYSQSGTLLRRNYPYIGVFKIVAGKYKGHFSFRIMCRACAYAFGRGVIEMDAETYYDPYIFREELYKGKLKQEQSENEEVQV